MKQIIVCVLCFFLIGFSLEGIAQNNPTKVVPKPYYPSLPTTSKPIVNRSKTTLLSSMASSQGIPAGTNPAPTPEVGHLNRFKDIPVNLFTGTPSINLPLYTLQEAELRVPISLYYNASGMKAGEVASWSGLGWNLSAGGVLTRIVRGLPDEGKLQMDSWTSSSPRKGYYQHWTEAYGSGNNQNDKEPDIFYLNIGGQSLKMIYHPFRSPGEQFVFFPEADILVQPTFTPNTNTATVGKFTRWIITMPDGIKYFFGENNAQEKTAEIEAKYAQDNNVNPESGTRFSHYWNSEAVTNSWYLTKIVSPAGHTIYFDYRSARYSFFKLADNEASQACPTNNVEKAINKVYAEGVILSKIHSENIQIDFNKECTTCSSIYDPLTGQLEFLCGLSDACVPPRLDVDQWTNQPANSSNNKKLVSIKVSDKTGGSTDTLKYQFIYDHFESNPAYNSLPSGYSTNGASNTVNIGTTHLKRLRLRSVQFPDSIKYEFSYHFEDAPTTFYSRLSYGIDHWGYLNGAIGVPDKGLLAKDDYNNCNSLSNHNSNADYAKYGLLSQIRLKNGDNLGITTSFDYEAHLAQNYQGTGGNELPIGGSRIKAIAVKDYTINQESTKRYTYLKPGSSQSSGFLVMKPIYSFHSIGPVMNLNSGLYDRLLTETNRPVVGYSFVKEEEFEGGLTNQGSSNGYSTYTFEQSEVELSIGIAGQLCDNDGMNCQPFTFLDPQNFHPSHDFRSGNLLTRKTYNPVNQLLSAQYMTYTSNGGIKTDSVLAKKIFRINGFNLGAETYELTRKYYTVFSKFRLESDSTETYNENGQNPVTKSAFYTYKDEMPVPYRQQFRGRHNQVVKVRTTDGFGYPLESFTKYTADYGFPTDSLFVPRTCSDELGNSFDCSYWVVSYDMPANGTEALPIFLSWFANKWTDVVEQFQRRNGQVIAGSYYKLFDYGYRDETFSLKNLPKSTLTEAYLAGDNVLKDADYYSQSRIQEYNDFRLPVQIKATRGSTSRISYDASKVLVNTTIQNWGITDAQTTTYQYKTRMFGLSKTTAPNLIEARYAYYPDGRLRTIRDFNNNVLQSYQYLNLGKTDSAGTVHEDFIYFYRQLVRTPRVPTTDPYAIPPNALISIASYTPSGGQHNQRFYRQSPLANTDIVTDWTAFDAFKRPVTADLPFPNDDNAVGTDEYAVYGDNAPTNVISYENNPLSRPKQTIGAGQAWRTANKTTQYQYLTAGSEVRQYRVLANETVSGVNNYANYTLLRRKMQDERGHWMDEFSDKEGRTVSAWVQDTTDQNGNPLYLKTFYVYDDVGRLRYIIPPAVSGTTQSFTEADPIFANGVYAYRYDGRGRVVEKHTPNAGWSYVVYNYLNQPVLIQDARQRSQNLWQWVKYDGHGRNVQNGTWTSITGRQTLQDYFDSYLEDQQFEERGNILLGYTSRSFPSQINLSANDVKAEYFYDDYTWVNDVNYNFQFYQTFPYSNAKGLATGSRVRRLGTGEWLKSVLYYDSKNRVIQGIAQNRFGQLNQTDMTYNFGGELLEERTIYRKLTQADVVVKNSYQRDHAGRITQLTHQINNQTNALATYHYDDIGRLKQKKILPQGFAYPAHIVRQTSVPNPTTDIAQQSVTLLPGFFTTPSQTYAATIANGLIMGPIQTVDYAYHIRGGLKAINSPQTPNGGLNVTENDLFSLRLDYQEDGRYYNGHISKQQWVSKTDNQVRSFAYTYDQADRFKGATFVGNTGENYTTNINGYDPNGNIKGLQRSGLLNLNSWGTIDQLTYDYGTKINQLQNITDAANATKGFQSNGSGGYTYYADGSLKSDASRGISLITYNYLGLVDEIQLNTNGRKIMYLYTADGQKLRKTISETGHPDFVVDYMGDLIYHNSQLVSIDTPEGRAVPLDTTNQSFTYQFFYNDHLGSLRIAYSVAPNGAYIVQENHFGPLGELLEGISSNSAIYPYLFQSKEREFAWGLSLDDFMTRTYDPFTGRMWQVDGADQFASGYVGMGNNAVAQIDPDGQFVPLVIAGAALIGGGINLATNWSKVKDWKTGAAYFLSGAAGGVTALYNPVAGGAVTSGANAVIDIATGNLPQLQNPTDYVKYVGKEVILGGAPAYAGAQAGRWIGPQLSKVFNWTQQGFAVATQQTIQIGGQAYSYVAEAGVKLSKSWIGSVGGTVGRAALPTPKTIARHHVFPDKFRPWFKQQGISNIDDYTIEMEHWTTHLKGVHGKGLSQFNLPGKWNARWADFIKANPNANPSQIFKFGEDLMSEYGFRFSKFVKYR